MRLLIVGAAGMLGTAVAAEAAFREWPVVALPRHEVDVRKRRQVAARLEETRPDWLVNCAAFTAVDRCEAESATAFAVNAEAVAGLAEEAHEQGVRLLQVSTDYVFDGNASRPYREQDEPRPRSVYGRSKRLGEEHALRFDEHLVVRTSWLFGPGGKNFVATIARLARERDELSVVDDQRGAPTYTRHLAVAMLDLIAREAHGIVHYRDREPATWYDLACAVVELLGEATRVRPVTTADMPRPAPRPAFSVLDVERFETLTGRPVAAWHEGLVHYAQLCPGFVESAG